MRSDIEFDDDVTGALACSEDTVLRSVTFNVGLVNVIKYRLCLMLDFCQNSMFTSSMLLNVIMFYLLAL